MENDDLKIERLSHIVLEIEKLKPIKIRGRPFETAEELLNYIQEELTHCDWDEILSDILQNEEFHGARFSGSSSINLIPSPNKTSCKYVVVALSLGLGRKKTNLGPICKSLSEHLAACDGMTAEVILIVDSIDQKTLADRMPLFEIYRDKGVDFRLMIARGKRLIQIPFFDN